MYFRRTVRFIVVVVGVGLAILPGIAQATALAPFIDLQEKGLALTGANAGLIGWGGGPQNLNVNVGGNVRFALLYWAGRQRPCTETSPGNGICAAPVEPFLDQEMIFDGNSLRGTIIGTESQPVSGGGPILNITYFADVTSIVAAKGAGAQTFTLADGNNASNLWRLNGASLLIGYTDAADTAWRRVIIFDGCDLAFGNDPTPGDNRTTAAININHGANLSARNADLLLVVGDCTADRPERVDIGNGNASVLNSFVSAGGAMWDHETLPINIPAGAGSTSVQLFSAPTGSANPDSLIWVAAALRVQQLDTAKAKCPITLNDPGPPAHVEMTVQDTGTGLAEIVVTKSENADTVVPPFTVGTKDPVVVSSTKIDQTQRARVEARVTDLAGNVALCDPILQLVIRQNGQSLEDANTDVPRAEDKVTVTNGSPGVSNLEVRVNGTKFKLTGLKDGEQRTLDISSAMVDGNNNVTLKATGKPGGWINVMIWDGVSE